jgi:hypothetical protein
LVAWPVIGLNHQGGKAQGQRQHGNGAEQQLHMPVIPKSVGGAGALAVAGFPLDLK